MGAILAVVLGVIGGVLGFAATDEVAHRFTGVGVLFGALLGAILGAILGGTDAIVAAIERSAPGYEPRAGWSSPK